MQGCSGWQKEDLLANVIAQIVTESAIRSCAMATGQPIFADDAALGLASGCQWSRRRSHGLSNEITTILFVQRWRGHVGSLDESHDSLAQIIAIAFENLLQLLICLVVSEYRAEHIVWAHVDGIRLDPLGGGSVEASITKGSGATGIVIDNPVDIVTPIIAIVLGGGAGFAELIGAQARTVRNGWSGKGKAR